MKDFTIDTIKSICTKHTVHGGEPKLPFGIPFLDIRMDEYQAKWNGHHSYYHVLKAIAEELKPSIVLEVGTWTGTSAACFAAGNPSCEVLTIDHHSDGPADLENRERLYEAVKEYPGIKNFQGCSTERVAKEKPGTRCVFDDVVKFLDGRKIDILWIDGWHLAVMAQADFDTYFPLMNRPSLLICDDLCGGSSATIGGMQDFWKGLPGREEDKYLDGAIHSGYPVGLIRYGGE